MRRDSEGVLAPPEFLPPSLRGLDPALVIEALEPHVGDDRKERLYAVLKQRLASLTVLFDAPYDPHNGAAVIRSCDAFGVGRLHVVERQKSFLFAQSVARGSERWVEVIKHARPAEAAAAVKAEGYTLVGAEASGSLTPQDLPNVKKLCLVMGNEHDGIAEELRAACDHHVRVPMRGFVESLNVSVTSAILLAAAVPGREGDLDPAELQRLYARALYLSVNRAADVIAYKLSSDQEKSRIPSLR